MPDFAERLRAGARRLPRSTDEVEELLDRRLGAERTENLVAVGRRVKALRRAAERRRFRSDTGYLEFLVRRALDEGPQPTRPGRSE